MHLLSSVEGVGLVVQSVQAVSHGSDSCVLIGTHTFSLADYYVMP